MAAKKKILKLMKHKFTSEIRKVPKWWGTSQHDAHLKYFKDYVDYDVIDNFEFTETLTFVRFCQVNSSFYGVFKRENGTHVHVWASNMDKFFNMAVNGKVYGTFTFAKHGTSIAIVLVNKSLF